MSEMLMILVMAVSGSLFALGGTGYKWMRRYLIPIFMTLICVLNGVSWWQSILLATFLCISLSLGYGSSTPYWRKALVFLTYGLSFLIIGWSAWVVLTPVICFSLFCLSNWKFSANTFFWKCVEFLYGTLIGITFISCITNRY